MTQFHFRLATVLKVRESARDQKQQALAQAQQAEALLCDQQQQLQQRLDELAQRRRAAAAPGAINVATLAEAQRFDDVLRAQLEDLRRQRTAALTEVERCRREAIEAERDVRMLETLREKQLATHRQHETRLETRRLDELTQQKSA